jgi:hypothetical protein
MINFDDKAEYDISDIQSLIDNEIEESIHLDFKEANALDKSDGKKKDISKDVSAFANSDGGILVYGVKELNHKAHSITYIDGNIYTKEWLEQTINSSIQKRISEIKIIPIRNNGNISETIYIVKVPKSYDTPHICRDKRFYKRFNFESVMMEEYEIRQLYGQRLKSKLLINGWSLGDIKNNKNNEDTLLFLFESSIFNDGDVVENEFKVNVYFININPRLIALSWDKENNYDHIWLDNNRLKLSSHNKTTIYPNEVVNAIRFNLNIPKNDVEDAFKDVEIEIMLFYSNGEEKMKVNLDLKKLLQDNVQPS